MKIRMRFTKTGSVRFIGHLDCMRFFQKAIRRAKLDVAYSQGFSPHQLMSFASPLGVGLTSDGEYVDVEFQSLPGRLLPDSPDDLPPGRADRMLPELAAYLNQFMTEEIFITEIQIMPEHFKNSMSLLHAADYMVVEKKPGAFPEGWQERWNDFLSQDEIRVRKKTKRSEVEVDLRPHIRAQAIDRISFEAATGQDYGTIHCPYQGESLYMQLASGSEVNIKPELVMGAFYQFCQVQAMAFSYQVHRLQMYFREIRAGMPADTGRPLDTGMPADTGRPAPEGGTHE